MVACTGSRGFFLLGEREVFFIVDIIVSVINQHWICASYSSPSISASSSSLSSLPTSSSQL